MAKNLSSEAKFSDCQKSKKSPVASHFTMSKSLKNREVSDPASPANVVSLGGKGVGIFLSLTEGPNCQVGICGEATVPQSGF